MPITLNIQQQQVKDAAVDWFFNKSQYQQVFQYSGGPGTGKTTLLHEIISALGLKPEEIAPMSFVGAAAMNMRNNGLINAKTIHAWLYRPVEDYKYDKNGNKVIDPYYNTPVTSTRFVAKTRGEFDADGIRLFIIDEGSMVPYSMKETIEQYGIPILVTGDIDQLPPVSDRSAYLDDPSKVMKLTEIMRQAKGSNIVNIAQACKNGEPISCGYYGDVLVIYDNELTDDMIATANIIICGKNVTKENFNNYVRTCILKLSSKLPVQGEHLVCRKNDWTRCVDDISLSNGLIGTIMNSPDISGFKENGKGLMIDFHPDILRPEFYFSNIMMNYKYLIAQHSEKEAIKNNKFEPKDMHYFDYGYAITSHLSQGSQFDNVIYYEEYLHKDINNKLNYVGVTRAKKNLIYVKKRPKYGKNFY